MRHYDHYLWPLLQSVEATRNTFILTLDLQKLFGRFPSIKIFILGSKCNGRESLQGEGEEPLGSCFHLRATQFLFLKKQWAHCVLQSNNQLSLAGLKQSAVWRAAQECLCTLRSHPSSCHHYPGENSPSLPARTLPWLVDPFLYIIYLSLY